MLIGGAPEADATTKIQRTCGAAIDLAGSTSFQDVVVLARGAAIAVGNDTGPMHLVAMAGCPSLVLFSGESNPDLCAPMPGAQGGKVEILQRASLDDLALADVLVAAQALLP